jgi:hypothetical protein
MRLSVAENERMVTWEYALLVRRRQVSVQGGGWEFTFVWYGPDGSALDMTPYGDTALAHLNRAGAQGWELVSVTEDGSPHGAVELHRYHLKRVLRPVPPRQRIRAGRTGRRPSPG